MKAYIAIDIGGTMIKAAVVSDQGIIMDRTTVETPLQDYASLMLSLKEIVAWGLQISPLHGIALSQPCVTDAITAKALSEGALIYIKDRNPAQDLGNHFGMAYSAENDGNCAALAEIWLGSAHDLHDIALVVCGTGVGGALIKEKAVHAGSNQFAGEFGMMIIGHDPVKNRPLMWSEVGSTAALVKSYAAKSGRAFETLNGKLIFEWADQGDLIAQRSIEAFYYNFALGLHNIQHVYDPQAILIGGGISTRPEIIAEIEKSLFELYGHFELVTRMPTIRRSTFLSEGNLIGAVYHHINMHP